MKNKRISQIKKSRMLEKIALADKALNEGSKDDLTLYNMLG